MLLRADANHRTNDDVAKRERNHAEARSTKTERREEGEPTRCRLRREIPRVRPPTAVAPSTSDCALIEAFLTNDRINQVLLEMLDPKVWREMPPCSKRRNIATSFAHMHNVRCMRLKMSLRGEEPPAKLDRGEVTVEQAKAALAQSAEAMARLIESGLAAGGRVRDHRPDVVSLVCGAIAHDVHHRGQICHWASQLGRPLSPEQSLQLWEWEKRWKDVVRG